jgi:2-methylisocitrate lyase-like PEP mutase family enzyme
MTRSSELRARLDAGEFITAPGVYDLISARLADGMGFAAIYMTGYGTVASHMGLPDAGLASYTDMVGRVERICAMTTTPLIADGDTGYGGLLNVRHTVRGYEAAGAAAIQLEDQEFPKKCGHTPGRRVIATEAMVRKIAVAADSRRSDDFLIVARTDARTEHGLDEAIARAHAYRKAGADILFVESPESEAELALIGRAFDAPALVNNVEGGRTPVLPQARLRELGFQISIFPATGFLAAASALKQIYEGLSRTGSSLVNSTSLLDFEEMNRVMGFEDVWAFEKSHAE